MQSVQLSSSIAGGIAVRKVHSARRNRTSNCRRLVPSATTAVTDEVTVSTAEGQSNPTLFSLSGNPAARCAEMVVAQKGIDVDVRTLQATSGVTRSEGYKMINPRGSVPLFVDYKNGEKIVMYESLAIALYLESEYPGTPLLPTDPTSKAMVLTRFVEVMNLVSTFNAFPRELFLKEDSTRCMNSLVTAVKDTFSELSYWEKYLSSGSKFLVGDSITLADTGFYPILAFMYRLGFGNHIESNFPKIASYYSAVSETEGAKKSVPPEWAASGPSDKFSSVILSAVEAMNSRVIPEEKDEAAPAAAAAPAASSTDSSASEPTDKNGQGGIGGVMRSIFGK